MRRTRSAVGALLVLTMLAVTSTVAAGGPAPEPPADVQAAAAAKSAADQAVAQLTSQLAEVQTTIAKDQARWQVAEQNYVHQRDLLVAASADHQRALAVVRTTQGEIDAAQSALRTMVSQQYTGGDPTSVGPLLVASDPSAVLGSLTLQRELSDRRGALISQLDAALSRQAEAERAAQHALDEQATATRAADRALADAKAASDSARAQEASLAVALTSAQLQQDSATAALVRATKRAADQKLMAQTTLVLANQYQADQARRAPLAPVADHWTPDMANSAVNRALAWLGTPYSFAGGNAAGPTLGVAADVDSRNDGHIVGFDCSGLSLYAWAPYLAMDHYATTQYTQVGHLHPDVTQLLPGDLVFWSDNGQAAGIGHVAIYLGGGQVIQAPHSGDIVRITPLDEVEPGYFGATRPLT